MQRFFSWSIYMPIFHVVHVVAEIKGQGIHSVSVFLYSHTYTQHPKKSPLYIFRLFFSCSCLSHTFFLFLFHFVLFSKYLLAKKESFSLISLINNKSNMCVLMRAWVSEWVSERASERERKKCKTSKLFGLFGGLWIEFCKLN